MEIFRLSARELNIPLFEGTYVMTCGPTYETHSEAKLFERMGAGALGMSTVNEILTATALGLRVVGISMITNLA